MARSTVWRRFGWWGVLAATLFGTMAIGRLVVPEQELRAAPAQAVEAPQGRGRGGGAPTAQPVAPMTFRYMGPAPAGRIASVVGVPGDPTTYYLGNASGGVWKSTDSGATFVPVFDDQPVQAIGALALAASDPNQVWAGT